MADEVDLERLNPRSHLAFGYGIDNCQGAPLARMKMAATFRAFAERAATMQVDGCAALAEPARRTESQQPLRAARH
jgi:cytochrome P450